MARLSPQPWERELRLEVKRRHGRGLCMGPHRGGRTQLAVRWSDGTRCAVTITTPWDQGSRDTLLAAAALVHEGIAQGVAPAEALQAAALCSRSGENQSEDPRYRIWCGLRDRCNRPTSASWPNYGGKGVQVDRRWQKDFQAFARHVGPRPSPEHSIDRIDPEGHYAPGNVRWALPPQQSANTRANKLRGGVAAEARIYREQAAALLEAADRLEAEHRRGRDRTQRRLRRVGLRFAAA